MKPRRWERWELRFLRRHYGRRPLWEIALCLERTSKSIRSRAKVDRLGRRRYWTPAEDEFIREQRGKLSTVAIAREIERTTLSVYQRIRTLGLPRKTPLKLTPQVERLVRSLIRQSLCNAHIARELECERHTISDWRARLGFPPFPRDGNAIAACPRCLARVRETTARQCREAGVSSLAQIRLQAWRKWAREQGWPEDLRPRAVQILNALYEQGPMTRRQLAEAIGMRTDYSGPHACGLVLHSNDPEGTYTAHLMKRGLVVRLGRLVKSGPKKGAHCYLYALPVHVERKPAG